MKAKTALEKAESIYDLTVDLIAEIKELQKTIKEKDRELDRIGNAINEQCDTINNLQDRIKELESQNAMTKP